MKLVKDRAEKIRSEAKETFNLNMKELNEKSRLEIKVQLLEIKEKNANNRYSHLLNQMSDLDELYIDQKSEIEVQYLNRHNNKEY